MLLRSLRFSLLFALVGTPAVAQITPDGTLPTTVSSSDSLNFIIDGGAASGSNLYHSFSQFSVPTGGAAAFNNAPAVETIFVRVTGGRISTIDGILQTSGATDLFLMNPAGVVFGANAQLNLGGSLIGTTAEQIDFVDGSEFSAIDLINAPLLTVSTPVGLQLRQQSGSIEIENSGHRITPLSTEPGPRIDMGSPFGLRVNPGETLGLIGRSVDLIGGVVAVPGGQTILGGVEAGEVQLAFTPQGWNLGFEAVETFGDVSLSQAALVDGSGALTSLIQLYGHDITLSDGSYLLINSLGTRPGGDIEVTAANRLNFQDLNQSVNLSGTLYSQNLGLGAGANIAVTARHVGLVESGKLESITYTSADAGNINVQVTDDLEIVGVGPATFSGIGTSSLGEGDGGQISVSARNIRIADGGLISASTLGAGDSGEVHINASESVVITGFSPAFAIISGIVSISLSPFEGNANQVTVNTARLSLEDSGTIGATAFGSGNAGNVLVNASESIRIRGVADIPFRLERASIDSSVLAPSPIAQELGGLQPVPTGDSGNVEVTTSRLLVTDRAEVAVRNEGLGDAGDRLQIQADEVLLDQSGSINAISQSGNGGNIILNVSDLINLRGQSTINTEALSVGDGGNIAITTSLLVALSGENSDIVANAVSGDGGNIDITTQGLFGLEFREALTPENDITASSELGISGTVNVDNPDVDPNSGLVELPAELVDVSNQIATGCADESENSFVATGRGGLPLTPADDIGNQPWSDVRDLSAFMESSATILPSETVSANANAIIVEMNGWRRNAAGQIELVASADRADDAIAHATCGLGDRR